MADEKDKDVKPTKQELMDKELAIGDMVKSKGGSISGEIVGLSLSSDDNESTVSIAVKDDGLKIIKLKKSDLLTVKEAKQAKADE